MAVFAGIAGKVTWDQTGSEVEIEHVVSWQADITVGRADATKMADAYRSKVPDFKDWTATVEARFDSGGLDVPLATNGTEALGENTPARLELWLDETGDNVKVLYGVAMCVGIAVDQDMSDTPMVTYTFEGQGAIAWDTTSPGGPA